MNILWITTDQQRADTIHALGNRQIRTPNLNRLCAEGTAFTRAYCQSPICTPSRTSFLTGLYPSTVHGNINGNARCDLPEGARLITRRLADAGYRCGLSGKLHLASPWNGEEERAADGFEEFHYSHSPTQPFDRSNQYVAWLEDQGLLDRVLDREHHDRNLRSGVRYREDVPFEFHQTTWCFDRALSFLQRHVGDQWCFCVNCFDPHGPFDPPRTYRDRYPSSDMPLPIFRESDPLVHERLATHVFRSPCVEPGPRERSQIAAYYAMIELIDENVGRLLDALEASGQREDTLVIFTSDHGEMLGDHGLRSKGCRFYEGLVRVPLILSWPGQVQQGLASDALVELTDIAPTLAEAAGVDPGWTQGKSLLPILTGEAAPNRHRDAVRSEFYDTLNPDFGKPDAVRTPSYATMYRDERWKLVVYHGNPYGELYDLRDDPDEFENRWEDPSCAPLKVRLLQQSFDATVQATDPGGKRIGRF